MFVVVLKGRVIAGPMDWNSKFFNEILSRNGVKHTFDSKTPDSLPLRVNDDVVVYATELVFPEYNVKTQYIHGPFWDYSTDTAVGTFEVKDTPIELVAATLKVRIADVRYKEEILGTKVTIQGVEVSVDTDRTGKLVYLQQLNSMGDADTVVWKFKEQWLTLSKSDVQAIVNSVQLHIQDCFTREYQKSQAIDAATTLAELDAIVLGDDPAVPSMPV